MIVDYSSNNDVCFRETWQGAHNRATPWELRPWSSHNAHAHKRYYFGWNFIFSINLIPIKFCREKTRFVKMGEGDEVQLRGGARSEYHHPRTIQEVSACLVNWRSALQRLWPWSYEAEVFIRVMEVSFARIILCERVLNLY